MFDSGRPSITDIGVRIPAPVRGTAAGPRRILGAVTQPHVVRRLLTALGLAAEPPPPKTAPLAAIRSSRPLAG
ncbi:MAG: hypothetical protein ACRELA_18025, partial [Candidatus Rokuibacteriota bacterium]